MMMCHKTKGDYENGDGVRGESVARGWLVEGWRKILDGSPVVKAECSKRMRKQSEVVPPRGGVQQREWRAIHEREHREMMRYMNRQPFFHVARKVSAR